MGAWMAVVVVWIGASALTFCFFVALLWMEPKCASSCPARWRDDEGDIGANCAVFLIICFWAICLGVGSAFSLKHMCTYWFHSNVRMQTPQGL
jgi:hypothetical protein